MKSPAFKELFTAWYDDNDQTIKGCTEGSLIWHHELRHKEQFNHPFFRKAYFGSFFMFQILGLICLYLSIHDSIGFYGVGLVASPYLVIVLLSEIDAWVVAFWRKHK